MGHVPRQATDRVAELSVSKSPWAIPPRAGIQATLPDRLTFKDKDVRRIHTVVQPSSPSVPGTRSSSQAGLCIKPCSQRPPPPPLICGSDSSGLLRVSTHTEWVPLRRADLTQHHVLQFHPRCQDSFLSKAE